MSEEHWLYAFVEERYLKPDNLTARELVDAILAEQRRLHPVRYVRVCPLCEMRFFFVSEDEAFARYTVDKQIEAHLAGGCYRDPFGPRR